MSINDLTPGPALECDSCGETTPVEVAQDDDCPICGEFATAVTLSACPDPSGKCDNEHHDFGLDVHVVPVDR